MGIDNLQPGDIYEPDIQDGADRPKLESVKHTLVDMALDGFKFFTPALLLTHGLFDRDPLVEYRRHHPEITDSEAPFQILHRYPFFSGLGRSVVDGVIYEWDHILYGVHSTHWESVLRFLSSLALYNARLYHYAKVDWQPLLIVDPTSLRSGKLLSEVPCLQITVFAIASYASCAYIKPAVDPPRTLPYLYVEAPRADIRREAEMVLGPPATPEAFAAMLKYKAEQE